MKVSPLSARFGFQEEPARSRLQWGQGGHRDGVDIVDEMDKVDKNGGRSGNGGKRGTGRREAEKKREETGSEEGRTTGE